VSVYGSCAAQPRRQAAADGIDLNVSPDADGVAIESFFTDEEQRSSSPATREVLFEAV
jgi:hypothetical protein